MTCFRILLSFLLTISIISCCDRYENVEGEVEFYLLDSYEREETGCAIVESSVVLEGEPLILYEDLLYYEPDAHTFGISPRAMDDIEALEHSVFGVAFGVTANGVLVYTGYFWPMFSSMSCDWITIDPIFTRMDSTMEVSLGYPVGMEGQKITDRRNDERILNIFRRDGKLRD